MGSEEMTPLDRFLDKLVEYMNKRYEKEKEYPATKYFAIKYCEGPPSVISGGKKNRIVGEVKVYDLGVPIGKGERRMKWDITATWRLPHIEELEDGEVVITSGSMYELGDALSGVYSIYEDKWKIIRALANKDNWEKLKSTYPLIVGNLTYADYLAEKVSRETGVKITHFVREDEEFTYFFTTFDSKGMSDEEKMRMIEKALDAIDIVSEFEEPANPERMKFLEKGGYMKPSPEGEGYTSISTSIYPNLNFILLPGGVLETRDAYFRVASKRISDQSGEA